MNGKSCDESAVVDLEKNREAAHSSICLNERHLSTVIEIKRMVSELAPYLARKRSVESEALDRILLKVTIRFISYHVSTLLYAYECQGRFKEARSSVTCT